MRCLFLQNPKNDLEIKVITTSIERRKVLIVPLWN